MRETAPTMNADTEALAEMMAASPARGSPPSPRSVAAEANTSGAPFPSASSVTAAMEGERRRRDARRRKGTSAGTSRKPTRSTSPWSASSKSRSSRTRKDADTEHLQEDVTEAGAHGAWGRARRGLPPACASSAPTGVEACSRALLSSSSLYGDTDDFDPFGDNNYVNGRTENDALDNGIKLNYHSHMKRQTRARWTKSDTDLFYQGLQQFGSDFAMIQQLFPDKSREVRQKFKSEEKKHPMQVHDAILHRSKDNVYLKQVIKQLNIEDLQRDINSTDKQEVASNEGDGGNENVSHVINEEEDNGPNWSDEELGTHQSEIKEGDHVSGNADDDDLDVFDWY